MGKCPLDGIKDRIGMLKKYINKRKKQVLKNPKHVGYLKSFHKHFVLVTADKAGSNVIVVCKKYYLNVILKELTSNPDLPTTYVMENTKNVQIIWGIS